MNAATHSALLGSVEQAIAAVLAVPADAPHPTAVAHALYESVYEANLAGLDETVDDLLERARKDAADPAARVLSSAYLQENDLQFRDPNIAGLDVRRVELIDHGAESSELQLSLVPTSTGALLPHTTRPGEQVILTIGTELQLMANNNLPEDRATVLHQRGFDFTHLNGKLEYYYGLRTTRRLAWGMAMVAMTDQRAYGVIFDEDVRGAGRSAERDSMPITFIEADGWGSVVVFSAERDLFDDFEIITALIGKSRPYVNIIGDCSLAMETYQVVERNAIVKPGKAQIADAVRVFMGA